MAWEDNEEDGLPEAYAREQEDPAPATGYKCKFCKKGGFSWEELDEGWRLVSAKGEIHRCKERNTK